MNFCTVTKLFLHFSTVYERKSSVEDSAEYFPAKIHGTFRLVPCSVKSNPAETGKKKKSGIRIIEFHIQSEKDILHIINSTKIAEGGMVRLYNFKRKTFLQDDFVQPFQKYMLYPTLKSFVAKEGYTLENWPEGRLAQSYGGKAVILKRIEGYSTSNLVQKMKG